MTYLQNIACLFLLACFLFVPGASASIVSFVVDDATLPDSNMDGFVNDSDFQPMGDDGTIFSLTPTDNLTGPDRFLLSDTNGLQYGGGGGSTLSFDFRSSTDISLESYTLGGGFFLSNPSFVISEGTTELSAGNTSNASGDTHLFNDGPILLTAGTDYTFEVEVAGAAVQAFMASWTYSVVPEPTTGVMGILLVAMLLPMCRTRYQA
jgi:hypothetical protein